MIVQEVKESLQRKKVFTFSIMLVIIMFLITVSALFQGYTQILGKEGIIKSFRLLQEYSLLDTLPPDELQSFWNEPNALDRLKLFYDGLETLGDAYVYVHTQPIGLSQNDSKIDESFLQGYESGNPWPPSSRDNRTYYSVKSVQLNAQAFSMFPISVKDGQSFSPEDFHESQILPVLLGASYSGIFEIGNTLTANYLGKDFEVKVIGLLEENSFVVRNDEIFLDRYIVMPAQQFGIPTDEDDVAFQQRHYLQIINGAIYSEDQKDIVQAKLEQVKEDVNFPHSALLGMPALPLGKLFNAIDEMLYLIQAFSIVLMVACILGITILMRKKIQDNYKNMMLHLISGGTLGQLFRYVLGEVFVLVCIPAILVTLVFGGIVLVISPLALMLYVLCMALCAAFIIIFSVIPIHLQFRRLPISQLLKREE